jgi:hypothetical protein
VSVIDPIGLVKIVDKVGLLVPHLSKVGNVDDLSTSVAYKVLLRSTGTCH